jgi:hypothetical protein
MIPLTEDWNLNLSASAYRLRFELNAGGASVSMFTVAYDRARALARAALGGEGCIAIIAADPTPWDEPWAIQKYGAQRDSAFDVLGQMGVDTSSPLAMWQGAPYLDYDDGAVPWAFRALQLSWVEADILLWSQIAADIGVQPHAPVIATLVDPARDVSVWAYDDRGMDITALSPEALLPLYRQYDSWLLDYDRARMARMLGSQIL